MILSVYMCLGGEWFVSPCVCCVGTVACSPARRGPSSERRMFDSLVPITSPYETKIRAVV